MPVGVYKHKPHSTETKRKMRETRKRLWQNSEYKEMMQKVQKGKTGTYERTSEMETGRHLSPLRIRGKNHPNWKGGISKKPQYISWIKNKRNRLLRGIFPKHTFQEWESLKRQYNYVCPACGKKEPEIKLTEDHIIPLIKDGLDNIENIQPLCRSCNSIKHTKIIKYAK